ncbi:hypothetical protein IAM_22543 [Escherichia coli XH001]|nr:hypothetical protein IAM_22543 [Escherichia coli XH001]
MKIPCQLDLVWLCGITPVVLCLFVGQKISSHHASFHYLLIRIILAVSDIINFETNENCPKHEYQKS